MSHPIVTRCADPAAVAARTADVIVGTSMGAIIGAAYAAGLSGLGNVQMLNGQYAVKDGTVYVLEVNPRASRTVPFVSKATGVPLARIGALVVLGLLVVASCRAKHRAGGAAARLACRPGAAAGDRARARSRAQRAAARARRRNAVRQAAARPADRPAAASRGWIGQSRGERSASRSAPPPRGRSPRSASAATSIIAASAGGIALGTLGVEFFPKRPGGLRVTVIAPVSQPKRGYVVYQDTRRAAAGRRLDRTLSQLREHGIAAHGLVVESDPVTAVRDALSQLEPPVDEIVVATHPQQKSGWLRKNVVDRIAEGKVEKFYQEAVLTEQAFVKDPEKTVGQVVVERGGKEALE